MSSFESVPLRPRAETTSRTLRSSASTVMFSSNLKPERFPTRSVFSFFFFSSFTLPAFLSFLETVMVAVLSQRARPVSSVFTSSSSELLDSSSLSHSSLSSSSRFLLGFFSFFAFASSPLPSSSSSSSSSSSLESLLELTESLESESESSSESSSSSSCALSSGFSRYAAISFS